MKKTNSVIFLFLILVIGSIIFYFSLSVESHGGKTDGYGGHYNRSTGTYHYHHGFSAHQHSNGICPYDGVDMTDHSPGTSSGSSSSSDNDYSAKLIPPDEDSKITYTHPESNSFTSTADNKDAANVTSPSTTDEDIAATDNKVKPALIIPMSFILMCILYRINKNKQKKLQHQREEQQKLEELQKKLEEKQRKYQDVSSILDMLITYCEGKIATKKAIPFIEEKIEKLKETLQFQDYNIEHAEKRNEVILIPKNLDDTHFSVHLSSKIVSAPHTVYKSYSGKIGHLIKGCSGAYEKISLFDGEKSFQYFKKLCLRCGKSINQDALTNYISAYNKAVKINSEISNLISGIEANEHEYQRYSQLIQMSLSKLNDYNDTIAEHDDLRTKLNTIVTKYNLIVKNVN